mgnify:CR=1 FL=1
MSETVPQSAASLPHDAEIASALGRRCVVLIGMMGAGAADLTEASNELADSALEHYENLFVEAVAKTLRASGLMAAYKPAGLTARQLAETLSATARGFKYSCGSRTDFVTGFTIAVRAMCMPLREPHER